MAIRVSGANRRFTTEIILNAALGMLDKYGNPFELIHLDWTSHKKCGHGAKTKGDFDDVLLIRGTRGIVIQYRSPGSIEWLKDGLSGRYTAMVAHTEKNLRLLASMHYDKLWTIKEAHIRAKVEEMADVIEENNKKVFITHNIVEYEKQADGTMKRVEKKIKESMYEAHKRRREAHFKGPRGSGSISRPNELQLHTEQVNVSKEAELNKREAELKRREAELLEKEKSAGVPATIPDEPVELPISDEYSREDLEKLIPVSKLKKLARDEFGIEKAFTIPKEELIDMILEKQTQPTAEGAVVN